MINALNLTWIIPLSVTFALIVVLFIIGSSIVRKENKAYHKGFKDGYNKAKEEIIND